ncbi:hypothetical protein F511_08214 [Dorcoceras hygrometricum]|uniref:Remorin C-terminal domain-containing protein n=1 Tax=Dorcoceras hygrometricum TaxID=472368 RepID=A0A2Z7BYN1_9LAMI|nr:hypothetical protein F511_08214 [Dorcoceras hygrometricum]
MRKNSGSLRNSGTYTSPGTPEHGDIGMVETPKGWSSERAMLNSSSRRHITYAAALIPFNSGRALPSKWDDAERWIRSPVMGHESFNGATVLKSFVANAMSKGFSSYDAGTGAKSGHLYCENAVDRSTSVPGLSNFLGETSAPSSREVGLDDGTKEEDGIVSCGGHMSTQMSPEERVNSSSKRTFLYSILASSSLGPNSNPGAEDETRDVQVDKRASTGQQSKKQGERNVEKLKNVQAKLLREEAKISAWENLQQAKADAAIQKLEMKLEKKRSVSMDKILNKLRAAQMKADAMRNSVLSERHENRTRRISCLGSSCGIFVNLPSLVAREDSP